GALDCRVGPDAGSRASRRAVLARPLTSATEILPAEVVIAMIYPNSFKNVRLGSRAGGTVLFPAPEPPRWARVPSAGGGAPTTPAAHASAPARRGIVLKDPGRHPSAADPDHGPTQPRGNHRSTFVSGSRRGQTEKSVQMHRKSATSKTLQSSLTIRM